MKSFSNASCLFKWLMLPLFLCFFLAVTAFVLVSKAPSMDGNHGIVKLDAPKVDLRHYRLRFHASSRILEIKATIDSNDEPGPLPIMVAALQKYPKARKLSLVWTSSVASSWSEDRMTYDRPKHTLRIEGRGGQGDYYSQGRTLFAPIIDANLKSALRQQQNQWGNSFGAPSSWHVVKSYQPSRP